MIHASGHGWNRRCGRIVCWRPWVTGSEEVRMPSSLSMGFSPYRKPMLRRVDPERVTADWRAVCGRTACTVRRAGRTSVLPDPYVRPRGRRISTVKVRVGECHIFVAESNCVALRRGEEQLEVNNRSAAKRTRFGGMSRRAFSEMAKSENH